MLQSKVFPNLDSYCAARGYQFHAVDLRWGVSQEAQLDQRTTEICLDEVAEARRYPPPNLLIMVADRYGWVPPPFAIAQDEFDAVVAWLAEHGRAEAVGNLRKVYQLDKNHLVPPGLAASADGADRVAAYTLRSREEDMRNAPSAEALKKLEDDWTKLENKLRLALQEAAEQLARDLRIGEAARAKYFLSLTEQEIIHGLPGYASAAGNEAQSPAAAADTAGAQSIAWIREDAGDVAQQLPSWLGRIVGAGSRPSADAGFGAGRDPRVETLKAGIRRALPGDCVLSGQATRTGEGRLDAAYLEDFAARIESRLQAAIDGHIAERAEESELARERAEHAAFADERRSVFRGRDSQRAAIASYLGGSSQHPLVLFGPSGLGKSALMARAVAEAETAGPGVPVVYRFVGASAASADVRSLLVSVIKDLADHGAVASPDEWEDDANKFDEQVRTLLKSISRRAVVFVDALDQLKKPYRLGWLPDQLPPGLKFVASVLSDAGYDEDSSVYRVLRQRLPSEAFLGVEPLSETDGRATLLALEASVRRELRPSQRDYVLKRFEAAGGSPLYLRVAFEIARAWRSWDEAGAARCVLVGDTAALIGQLIAELTSVHHHEPALVSRTLGLLAAAKDGLSAKETAEVLSADAGVIQAVSHAAEKHGVPTPLVERHGARRPKLPDSVWVRLHRQLAPLLTEKRIDEQPLLTFFHRQLADVAHEQHYAPVKAALHSALTDYFDAGIGARPSGSETAAPTPISVDAAPDRLTYPRRTLSELPYQLFHAGRRARLGEILMAPHWMQQKLAAHGVRSLIDDYRYAHTQAQRLAGQTLDLASGVLAHDECQLVPQILGRLRPDLTDDPHAADNLLRGGRALVAAPALAPRWQSFTAHGGPELRRFEGHGGPVRAVAFSPDGCHLISGAEDGTLRLWQVESGAARVLEDHLGRVTAVAFSPDGSLISGSTDHTLRLWEVKSGASRLLGDHLNWVKAVVFSPDGRHLVSGGAGHTLQLCEVASGASRVLEGHLGGVNAVAFSPHGRHLVSGSTDNTLRLWEVESGASRVLEGHLGGVNAVAFSPDGRHLVSGSTDNTLRLWEVESGASRVLEGHLGEVNAVAFSPDGRQLVSGSTDNTLRLWAVESGASRVLEGHGGWVWAVAFSPDGRHVASGGNDHTLRLWEVNGGGAGVLEGHRGRVTAVAFFPDGSQLVSGSYDRTLRLWKASGASCVLEGHLGWVRAVAFSPDGRHLVSGLSDCTLLLWEVANGAARVLKGHGGRVTSVAFSPDGRQSRVLTTGRWRLWEVGSGASRVLEGHGGWVWAVAFSPDGRHLASGSADKTLRLWEGESGRELARLDGDFAFHALSLAPDGKSLAAGDDGGRVHLIDIILDEADKAAWLTRQGEP